MGLEKRVEKLETRLGKDIDQYIVNWAKLEKGLKSLEVSDVCCFGIEEMSKTDDSKIKLVPGDSSIVIELLKIVGGKRIKDAMESLDSAKNIILECTVVHEKYKY